MKNLLFIGFACLLMGLIAQPVLAGTLVVDFENPTYIGAPTASGSITPPVRGTAPTQLVSDDLSANQDGWYNTRGVGGNSWDVYTYQGNQVPFEETRASQQGGGHQLWTAPMNIEGGDQFIALGCGNALVEGDSVNAPGVFDTHTNQGATNKKRLSGSVGGEMTFSFQYANAYEYDFGLYSNAAYVQDYNPADDSHASVTGAYARQGTSADGTNTGPWAPAFWIYDSAGNRINTDDSGGTGWPGCTFYGVPGFDDLPMETWYEISITADLDPNSPTFNQILALSTRDINSGAPATVMSPVLNPFDGSPTYIGGGMNSTLVPDTVGLYNVGYGSVSAFDNLSLTGDVQVIPEPTTALMLLAGLALLPIFRRRR